MIEPATLWSNLYLILIMSLISFGALVILKRIILTHFSHLNLLNRLIILSRWLFLFSACAFILSLGWIFLPTPSVTYPAEPFAKPVDVDPNHPFTVIFNRPISRSLKPSLTPPTPGSWVYQTGNFGLFFSDRLVFTPAKPLDHGLEYTLNLDRILPVTWMTLKQAQKYLFVFSTPSDDPIIYGEVKSIDTLTTTPVASDEATLLPENQNSFSLAVPLYKQHYKFTCYTAAAQMVLAYRQITSVTELGFLKEIGYDSTPKNQLTNTWGDPNRGVVGTFDGTGDGGYGAHWDPVAKALGAYRQVEVMHHWNLNELLEKVKAGNPVMVWWVNGVWPAKELTWNSSDGEKIRAVNGMHVEVVTGWVGPMASPTYILTNDPWRGHRRYIPSTFTKLWQWFDNTAIVVY